MTPYYEHAGITIYLGDCLEIMPTLQAASVDLVLCDLPYGTTACKWDAVIPFAPLWAAYRRVARQAAPIILHCAQPFTAALVMSNVAAFKYQWVWQKDAGTGFGNCNRQPLRDHEDIAVFYSAQPVYHPQFARGAAYTTTSKGGNHASGVYAGGGLNPITTENTGRRFPKTVLAFAREKRGRCHPTQKPVALMEYLIRTYTNPGDTVLDNCMGSGSTGVACINTGRNFIGIEIEERYCEIAAKRLAQEVMAFA